jgi:hypothetical protein
MKYSGRHLPAKMVLFPGVLSNKIPCKFPASERFAFQGTDLKE